MLDNEGMSDFSLTVPKPLGTRLRSPETSAYNSRVALARLSAELRDTDLPRLIGPVRMLVNRQPSFYRDDGFGRTRSVSQ